MKNNNLKPKKFPMPIRFGEKPVTEFKNALKAIKITLVQAPSLEQLKGYCIPFANATWADNPLEILNHVDSKNGDLIMHHIFNSKILPTTMEAIRVNFLIEGISLQEVTHILRYRRAVFSAECSGDKWLTNKDCLVPTAIENSDGYQTTYPDCKANYNKELDFNRRYKEIVRLAKELYVDMIDSKCVTPHDARTILPRSIETHYFMSMSLKDALTFVWDRIDKQIQPVTDNILAYQMMYALIEKYPILVKTLNYKYLHQPARFYTKTARQYRSTNWFKPDADSDIFGWNEKDFVYGDVNRDDINGTNPELAKTNDIFRNLLDEIDNYLLAKELEVDRLYGIGFFDQDIPEEIYEGGK